MNSRKRRKIAAAKHNEALANPPKPTPIRASASATHRRILLSALALSGSMMSAR